jgi:hypothetical protein
VASSPLWDRYLRAFNELTSSRMALSDHKDEVFESVRQSLLAPGWECPAALAYIPFLKTDSALLLLDTLISAALSVHGSTIAVRSVIADLPRAEAIAAIDAREQRVVAGDDFEAWGCLMELWEHVGMRERGEDLARRGLQSTDEDIRDISDLFLSKVRNP